jgi:spermidine/putrescine transport system substrate-binding protein
MSEEAENVALRSDFWNFPIHVAAVASQEASLAEELQDESMHSAVFDVFEQIDQTAWIGQPADMWQFFENDVIDIGMSNTEQSLADDRVLEGDFSQVVPSETAGYLDMFVVVRGTDKRDLAEEYINFVLSQEVQETWAEGAPNLYANSNVQYPGGLQDTIPTTEEQFQGVAFPDWNTPLFEFRTELAETFNSEIADV